MLANIKIGWKQVNKILNDIINEINKNCPARGDGITISDSVSGKIISVIPKDDSSAQTDNSASGSSTTPPTTTPTVGQWQPIDVYDSNCNKTTIYVWSTTTPPAS